MSCPSHTTVAGFRNNSVSIVFATNPAVIPIDEDNTAILIGRVMGAQYPIDATVARIVHIAAKIGVRIAGYKPAVAAINKR